MYGYGLFTGIRTTGVWGGDFEGCTGWGGEEEFFAREPDEGVEWGTGGGGEGLACGRAEGFEHHPA